jgi:preprotein translocase subunit SecF
MMNMIHQEKTELGVMAVSAFFMLTLMLVLGNLYAITGIAIAFSVGLAFKNLASLYFVRKFLAELSHQNS